jgi:K+-sensing histidine kinase KdpD
MLRELERRPLQTVEVDLAGAARSVVARLGVADRVVVAIPKGTVAADHELVIEIVTDLLDRALENAPDGSTITICADSEKSGLRLWVSHHGARIDPAERTAFIERSRPA